MVTHLEAVQAFITTNKQTLANFPSTVERPKDWRAAVSGLQGAEPGRGRDSRGDPGEQTWAQAKGLGAGLRRRHGGSCAASRAPAAPPRTHPATAGRCTAR